MLPVILSLILGALLAGSAMLKLADGPRTRAALATYGIHGRAPPSFCGGRSSQSSWYSASTVVVGLEAPPGPPPHCLRCVRASHRPWRSSRAAPGRRARASARGRVGRGSLARAGCSPAAPVALLPALERRRPSTEGWLAMGLAAAAARGRRARRRGARAGARAGGAAGRDRSARGAGDPRGGAGADGGRTQLMEVEPGRLGLAVFTSEGCGMCRALGPAIEALGRDPLVRLKTFDEVRRRPRLGRRRHPRLPFAVALDAHGTVLAKGTFNTAGQLESVLATAERRRG